MEEGQTVEIQETREPLREQGSVRALLELLEQQGMEQEKRDVLCMADYIDSMEMQLGTVLKELGKELNLYCFFPWRFKRVPVLMAGTFVILPEFKLQG